MTQQLAITGLIHEYTAADGTVLKYRHYAPPGQPRAYVVGVHGIQSHSGWYEWSSTRFAAAGCDVRFLDRRGSGLNEGERGHTESGVVLCADVLRMVNLLHLEREHRRQPIILCGVSWAGNLLAGMPGSVCAGWPGLERRQERNPGADRGFPAIQPLPPVALSDRGGIRKNSAAAVEDAETSELSRVQLRGGSSELLRVQRPGAIDGVALMYPAIFTHFDPNVVQRGAIRTAVALRLGRRTIPIPLDDPALFTDDPAWQRFIRDDPLTLRRVSLSFLAATLDLTDRAKEYPERNPSPTFIALAGRDRIVDRERTRDWIARLPAESTRLVEYSAARHTLEFDQCREQFVADLIDWIESLVHSRQR